ncbi:MAG: hypothetical protein ACI90R_001622, partial [Alteromonas macleodii]
TVTTQNINRQACCGPVLNKSHFLHDWALYACTRKMRLSHYQPLEVQDILSAKNFLSLQEWDNRSRGFLLKPNNYLHFN